jgi:DNA-binding NtrC family response regulator
MKNAKRQILVIDDDEVIQSFLKRRFFVPGYELIFVSTAEAALHRLNSHSGFDLILSDLRMPRMDGLELLRQLKSRSSQIPVILMTAHGSLETALEAMRAGAYDYILKPLNLDELSLSIEKAIRFQQLERDNSSLRKEIKESWKHREIIGKSRAMHAVFELVERVAPTQANVLIHGESGTGKELVARAVHFKSLRKDGPFVAINCSAIPADLLESELFGHAKGSFTGAHQTKKGLFEEAEGGTLFLDEIGDMDLSLQAKLLRAIQEKTIRPVGETTSKEVDVRIVAATHRDLRSAVKNNQFREDLYYRLCVIPVEIPPLRNRKDDIPILSEHFLNKHAATHGLNVRAFSGEAMQKLIHYHWPGNVRELENCIERAVILTRSEQIQSEDLPVFEMHSGIPQFLEGSAAEMMSLEEVEKVYISLVLGKAGGKKEKTAQILGIDRKTLRKKIRDYQLEESNDDETLMEERGMLASTLN